MAPKKKSTSTTTAASNKKNNSNNNNKKKKQSLSDDEQQHIPASTKTSIQRRSTVAAPQSTTTTTSSTTSLIIHGIIFTLIAAIDISSDFVADFVFHGLGVVFSLIRIINPTHFLMPEIFDIRAATRVLRPYSLFFAAQKLYLASSASSTVSLLSDGAFLFSVICIFHDALFACAGFVTWFAKYVPAPVATLVKSMYRETWFLLGCIRFYFFFFFKNDYYAAFSCICEILATNSLLYVMLSGGNPIPPRILGVLGAVVTSQKFYYLVSPHYDYNDLLKTVLQIGNMF